MNVLLVRTNDPDQNLVLSEVAKELHAFGIRVRLVWDVQPRLKHRLWALEIPTCVIGLKPIRQFKPDWAEVFQPVKYDKIQEYERFAHAGVPVPKWTVIHEGENPDLSDFGDYVVTKPAAGCRGAFVWLMRRNRVKWRPLELEHRRGESTAIIIQEYIHTGPTPISFRVGTFFGEPFYAHRTVAASSRTPFQSPFRKAIESSSFFSGKNIVSTSKGCVMDEEIPLDVIEFATRAHEAFPDIPLLATDVIRDFHSGELYVLEANTAALNAMPTPNSDDPLKRDFGLDAYAQFGGAKAMACGILRRIHFYDKVLAQ